MHRYRLLALSLLALALLAGCFATVEENRYYLLEYVPTPPAERLAKGPYPFSLRVKDFEVAEAYRRNNLVYRQSPHELRFYSYELWAVKPEYLVTDMVVRHLETAKLFYSTSRSLDMEEPDYVLSGQVMALEEYDNGDEWFAHLSMGMSLQHVRTRQVIWSRTWDYRKKVRQLEPVFVVRELSQILETITEQAVASIDSVMASGSGSPNTDVPMAPTEYRRGELSTMDTLRLPPPAPLAPADNPPPPSGTAP